MKNFLRLLCCVLFFSTIVLGYTVFNYKEKAKHRFQVSIPIDATLFQEKLASPPPEWVLQQIHADLDTYKETGISKSLLDAFFEGKTIQTLKLIRFTIKDRQVSCSLSPNNLEHRQFRHLLAAFEKLNQLTVLPDVDFILSLHDGFSGNLDVPLFVYAKSEVANSLVLMPDFKALTGYPYLREEMEQGSQKWSWDKKLLKAFWRGSTTGGWLTAFNWHEIPRVKLALLGHAHPNQIDARITGVVQCDPEIPSLIQSKGLLGKMVSQADHLKYKYVVDVDGNSCSFERYFWALLSNSLVLKQMTPNVQWYYKGLKPYEHFVPVKEDLSDLLDQITWAQTHDVQAQQIAETATAFIKNEVTIEDTFVYMTHLLREYAKLQTASSK
jgi:hypothetical protein